MGEVIRFSDHASGRRGRHVSADTDVATVIILPVIRIERGSDSPNNGQEPQTGTGPRRRRRRATR